MSIERSALGRSGYLGGFYDAREDKFCHGSLFKSFRLPDSCVHRVDITGSEIEYSFEDSYSKRCEKLDVAAELKVSLFAGLLSLKGSGKYLLDDKDSSRSIKGTVSYHVRTKEETLNIFDEDLKPFVSLEALTSTNATHFVGGIVWGAHTFASFEYRETRARDLSGISGDLLAELRDVTTSIKGRGDEPRYRGLNDKSSNKFDIKVYGDVIPAHEELPKTKVNALALLRKVPTYVADCNDGKGKPITFVLLPLSDVAKMMKIDLPAQVPLVPIDSTSVLKIQQLFGDLATAKLVLHDLYEDVTFSQVPYFSTIVKEEINTYKNNVEIAESELRSKIKQALVKARTDQNGTSLLEDILKDFSKSDFSPAKIKEFPGKYRNVVEKIDFVGRLRSANVTYSTSESFGVESIRLTAKNFYALVFVEMEGLFSTEIWKQNVNTFFQLLTNCEDGAGDFNFYVLEIIDADNFRDGRRFVSIYKCVDSVVETEDAHQVLLRRNSAPLARSSEVEFGVFRPNKSSPVELRCPGSIKGNCPLQVMQWKCARDKCLGDLYYGYDGYIYCDCGKAKASSFSFKCPDPNHGAKWIEFAHDDYFGKMMEELVHPEEINILILGETGVGKSTFINAFANYLTFNTLEEAENSDLLCLIPTSFTVTEEDFTEKIVSFGSDVNESGKSGESQTQGCRSYTFVYGDRLVRLIDTPGIGDTRGVDQDLRNLESTLSFVSNYEILHGICILLKPNNSRVTVALRFCVQELLCHVHRNACENVAFFFTNARTTFYRPGDTMTVLRSLLNDIEKRPPYLRIPLNKTTVFTVDNEAFRYLVARKSDVKFPKDTRDCVEQSWGHAVEEFARFSRHLRRIKPHLVSDTVSLNEARKLVTLLSLPLLDICRNIRWNIRCVEEREMKIQRINRERDVVQFVKELYAPFEAWRPHFSDQPRTVCASDKCYTVGSLKVCHDPRLVLEKTSVADSCGPCFLDDGWTSELNNGDCVVCGCSSKQHLHVYYEIDQVEEARRLTTGVDNEAQTPEAVNWRLSEVLRECRFRRQRLEEELKTITAASAQFAHFLKIHSIIPYNDALSDYLHYLIVLERSKSVVSSGNQRMVDDMVKTKRFYDEQLRVLDRSDSDNEPEAIIGLVGQLYSLEINGSLVREIVEKQQMARKRHLSVFHEKIHCVSGFRSGGRSRPFSVYQNHGDLAFENGMGQNKLHGPFFDSI